jgi:hypothetical protein
MENKKQNAILKAFVLVVSWFTLSPLLLIFDGRWKLLPKWLRILLFLLSPLMLVVFFVLGIIAYFHYQDYWRKNHFVKPWVIENITGVKMPKYKVIERNLKGGLCDHYDTFILEFKETPDSTFFQTLRDKDFDYYDGCYHFHLNLGSGLVKDEVVPKGEKGNYDYSMTICEGAKTFTVRVMEL